MDQNESRPIRVNSTMVIGGVILAVGLYALFARIFNIRWGADWWPLLFLLPGLGLLGFGFSGRRANAGMAIPGAILATLGGIFLFQVSTGNWESWAYIWALFPLAAGLTTMAVGQRNGDEDMTRTGLETARWSAIVFVIGLVFFELIIFGSLGGYLIPIALIVVGGLILWNQARNRSDGITTSFDYPSQPPPVRPAAPTPPPRPSAPAAAAPSVIVPPPPPTAGVATPPPLPDAPPAARSAASVSGARSVSEMPSGTAVPPPVPAPADDAAPFPPDELPHEPPAGDSPFPPDEHSPASAAKPKAKSPKPRKPRSPPAGP
jgi:hypothetical protein